jgi:hypothetical protein
MPDEYFQRECAEASRLTRKGYVGFVSDAAVICSCHFVLHG